MWKEEDYQFMSRAIHLAKNGKKKHCVYKYFEKSRGAMLRPEDVETKN